MIENTGYCFNSRKVQWSVFIISMCACVAFLGTLEENLQSTLDITYQEYYQRPFALSLDPFLYTYLVNGYAETDPPEPDPRYMFSHEETLLSAFFDYYTRTRYNYDAVDSSIYSNLGTTIRMLGNHIRGLLYYKLERSMISLSPVLEKPEDLRFAIRGSEMSEELELNEVANTSTLNPYKLVWNVVPWCWDPLLEESLHELENKNGFLFVRGHALNYRFPDKIEQNVIALTMSSVPVKTAYLHEHSFIDFRQHGLRPPVYVSVTCEPLKRKLRHFYTDRQNYRHYSGVAKIGKTSDAWWNMTLEECMSSGYKECQYEGIESDRNQEGITWAPRRVDWVVSQFCSSCRRLEKSSLKRAKATIKSNYAVVGTLEQMDQTLDVLEAQVPQFFKGIKQIYRTKLAEVGQKGEDALPEVPEATLKEMKARFADEIEFYDFVSERLATQHQNLVEK